MATNIIELAVELATHAGQVGINHVGKRLDSTIPQPPQPPQFAPPPWNPPTFQPLGGPPNQHTTVAAPSPAPAPAASTGVSYSDQVAQGIACLNCTRGHVATAKTAAQAAVEALHAGDESEARRQWAIVAAEYDALAQFDWEPGKVQASPPEDQAIIAQVQDCVTQARAAIPTPRSVALAWGSANESERFAVSTRFTDRDAAEIRDRLQAIDAQGNYAERVELPQVTHAEGLAAKKALRNGRHVLDEAGTVDGLYRPETWAQASQHFEAAAVALTPTPTLAQAQAVATQCSSCAEQFYQGYFAKQAAKKGVAQ